MGGQIFVTRRGGTLLSSTDGGNAQDGVAVHRGLCKVEQKNKGIKIKISRVPGTKHCSMRWRKYL